MTENEMRLIEIIRENDDPEKALTTAVSIISSFLERLQSSEGQVPADPSVPA